MASMNPNLILAASQGIDVLGAMGRGNALAREQMDMQRQNALAGYYRTNADGLLAGDPNALAGLMGHDPQAALGMQRQRQEDAWRQDERQYQRGRDAKLDQRADQEWSMKVQQYAAGLSAQERAAQAEEITRGLAGAKHFYDIGDRAGYDAFLSQNGMDPAQYAFDNFPALAGQFGEAAKILGGGLGDTGLNPIFGRDGEGNAVVMQLTKDGKAVQTALPEGVSIDLGVQAEERAAGSARGKGRGEAELSLPAAYVEAEHVIGLVDDLMNDPYLKNMVGPINSRLPNTSADAARVQSRMDQVSGQGFMAARSFLKGQGQITDFESRRAEAAMSRMNAAQSYEDYVAALEEFQDAVRVGLMKVEAAARSGQLAESTPAPAAPPASSTSGQPARRRWSPDGGLQ